VSSAREEPVSPRTAARLRALIRRAHRVVDSVIRVGDLEVEVDYELNPQAGRSRFDVALRLPSALSDEQVEREQYLHRERRTGAFNRTLEIPVAINGDAASATFENGLLRLTLPKAETDKPRQIKVTVPTA